MINSWRGKYIDYLVLVIGLLLTLNLVVNKEE